MSEWSNEHAWKACVLVTVPRVRIPPCPLFAPEWVQNIFDAFKRRAPLGRDCQPSHPALEISRPRLKAASHLRKLRGDRPTRMISRTNSHCYSKESSFTASSNCRSAPAIRCLSATTRSRNAISISTFSSSLSSSCFCFANSAAARVSSDKRGTL